MKVPPAARIDTRLVESSPISASSSMLMPLGREKKRKKIVFGLPSISVRFGQTEAASVFGSVWQTEFGPQAKPIPMSTFLEFFTEQKKEFLQSHAATVGQ
jgi:hypothetical protein